MNILNPATAELIQQLADDSADSVAQKYRLAREAQPAWRESAVGEKKAALEKFAELVQRDQTKLADTLTQEVGKPIQQSINELNAFQGRIRFFIDHVEAELAPEEVHSSPDLQEVIAHEPLGVIGNISAWNYPYFVGGNVVLPALLTGNAVLYKPSEYASLTGLSMVRLLHEAGIPEPVVIAVIGGPTTGQALLAQPLDGIFFTGSVNTGRLVAEAAAKRFIPAGLELGGKDPAYAAADVDVASAASAIADGAFYNTGQSCCAVERVYVHASIYAEFLDAFVSEVASYKVGDPREATTRIGPLARGEAQIAHLESQVDDARSKGARILLGGKRMPGPGFYFEPTVLVDVDHSMSIMQEESFGPVIGIMSVEDDDEALRLMNDTSYGLTASVYTKDASRAERLLGKLDVGSAYWNCCDRVSPTLPWSGRRNSGMGVTLSTYGIEAFTRPKAWHKRPPPR